MVPSVTPLPDTTAPVATDVVSETVMFVLPLTKVAVNEVTTCVYVGTRVGDTVGALVGEAEGLGVGLPALYVGTNVGLIVGALLGEAEGLGVGTPALYVGVNVGFAVGEFVGFLVGLGEGESYSKKYDLTPPFIPV